MAKANIHPQVSEVLYKLSQGRSIKIRSTYKRSQDFLLESDIFTHAAWRTDEKVVNTGSAKISTFNSSFGGGALESFANVEFEEEKEVSAPKVKAPKEPKKKKEDK